MGREGGVGAALGKGKGPQGRSDSRGREAQGWGVLMWTTLTQNACSGLPPSAVSPHHLPPSLSVSGLPYVHTGAFRERH